LVGHAGADTDHALAIVKDEQQAAGAQPELERFQQWLFGDFLDPERGGNRARDQAVVGERGQFGEPDAVRVGMAAICVGSNFERLPRLAHAAGPVRVSRSVPAKSREISFVSRTRPTKLVSSSGKLC
jgi:hypothetical protein